MRSNKRHKDETNPNQQSQGQSQSQTSTAGAATSAASGSASGSSAITVPTPSPDSDTDAPIGVELEAEIDKMLDEKAAKSNFTVLNVKSMIRQVVKNQSVQKMIASRVRKTERKERQQRKQNQQSQQTGDQKNPNASTPVKEGVGDNGDASSSSDEDDDDDSYYFEPKLTRAKTKELLEKNPELPVWPISPAKLQYKPPEPPSETQILITQQDLPEESEAEDDEYVPKEADFQNQSDDDSISVTSASDHGSPSVSFSLRSKRTRSSGTAASSSTTGAGAGPSTRTHHHSIDSPLSEFKTPSPRRKFRKFVKEDAAIGLRTRSKLPLNDTPLEDLEKQFIPPDITTDMYDWTASDNTDYLQFLKEFMGAGTSSSGPGGAGETADDDEADPEYNIMEDEEQEIVHDKEEHRVDRAVKVPKKELNELFAELFDTYHVGGSEDELDDLVDGTSAGAGGATFGSVNRNQKPLASTGQSQTETQTTGPNQTKEEEPETISKKELSEVPLVQESPTDNEKVDSSVPVPDPKTPIVSDSTLPALPPPLFTPDMFEILRHQLQAHVQLLAQTYVLSVKITTLSRAAETATNMVTSLDTMAKYRGPNSVFRNIQNLEPAVEIVLNRKNTWPPKKYFSPSPIKKRILEAESLEYLSQVKDDPAGFSLYEKMILKVIGWSRAFMYPFLLPKEFYVTDQAGSSFNFTKAEDILIARGLDDLKSSYRSKSVKEDSKQLANYLLPARHPGQIYHRIRNSKKRKVSPAMTVNNLLYDYFQKEKVPFVDIKIVMKNYLGITSAICPFDQPLSSLDFPWRAFCDKKTGLEIINSTPKYIAIPKLRRYKQADTTVPLSRLRRSESIDSGTGTSILSIVEPQNQTHEKIPRSKLRKKGPTATASSTPILTKTFPFMNEFLNKLPDSVNAYAVNNSVGQPLFYYTIPAAQQQQEELSIPAPAPAPVRSAVIPSAPGADTSAPLLEKQDRKQKESKIEHNSSSSTNVEDEPVQENVNLSSSFEVDHDHGEDQDRKLEIVDTQGESDKENDITHSETILPDLPERESDSETSYSEGNSNSLTQQTPNQFVIDSLFEVDENQEPSSDVKIKQEPNLSRPFLSRMEKQPGIPPCSFSFEDSNEPEDIDIETIFTELFLHRAQQRIEGDGKNSALYNSFIHLLNSNDNGDDVDEEQLFRKVEELLKDYPDIIDEFAGMLKPETVQATGRFLEHNRSQIQLRFFSLIEELTPQLKSKVFQKLRILRSEFPLTKERVLTVIQSLVPEIQNHIIIDSIKALFMDLFCPQSTFTSQDFEKIEMDPDEPGTTKHEPHPCHSQSHNQVVAQNPHPHHTHTNHPLPEVHATSHEVVTLPPEKEVTATNTCPCKCHDDPTNSSFHSRSRHCEDCSLKFQSGKLYKHSGRTMKAINIEFSSPEIAKNVLAQDTPILKPKDKDVKIRPSSSSPTAPNSTCAPSISTTPTSSLKSGGINIKTEEQAPEYKKRKLEKSTSPGSATAVPTIATCSSSPPLESESKPQIPWSLEDDKIILSIYHEEDIREEALIKIQELLPGRNFEDIKIRLDELLKLFESYSMSEEDGEHEDDDEGDDADD